MSLATAEPREPLEKSATAFRTIKEAADELEVPQHVLRFWETRFAQVRPVKRAGGRRYYRPDDIDLLRGIRCLLHGQGYTIKGAQGILREKGVRFVQSVGRGEVEVAALSQSAGQDSGEDTIEADAETGGLSPDAHHLLGEALRDLYACRAILTDLRHLADADAPRLEPSGA